MSHLIRYIDRPLCVIPTVLPAEATTLVGTPERKCFVATYATQSHHPAESV